jgi:nucleoid-associated protein YgaU
LITSNSRYVSDQLVLITGSDGVVRTTIVLPEPAETQFTYTTHIVTGFDRLDQLAYQYLGDSSAWWQITNLNTDVTIDWTTMPVGATIRIPAN